MAGIDNLQPFEPGHPKYGGKIKGSVNRKTILNYFLFEFDPEQLVPERRPAWWDKVKPKTIYEAATLAMGIQAMGGDTKAFNALNRALGDYHESEANVNVVHIYKPEKLSIDDLNAKGDELRKRTRDAVEAEVIDDRLESPAGAAGNSFTGTE